MTEYLDDALSETDLARFNRHLVTCEACSVFLDQIRMTIRLASATSGQEVEVMPANFDELVAVLRRRR